MSVCEMCGREASLVSADVEGVELKVCPVCTRYGTTNKNQHGNSRKTHSFNHKPQNKEEVEWKIVDNFSALIKSAREEKGMTQEDFAKFINERESILSKWEQGTLKPRIFVARRLGQTLGMTLVTKDTREKVELTKGKSSANEFTLGDFIKKPRNQNK
jgi:putative transcription factor